MPSLLGGNAWVIRGGYGIAHSPLTGQNRNPVPNFSGGAANFGETSGQTNPAYVTRLGSNPPYDPGVAPEEVLGLANNPSGLVYDQAINFPGNLLIGDGAVPYVQNWSLSLQRGVGSRGVLELSYAGSKGTHLFMPAVILNNPSADSWQPANAAQARPSNTPAGAAQLAAFQQMILSQQNGKGTLPANFFTLPLPAHIASASANDYNILDPSGNGFKYYEIRSNLNSGTAVGGALNYNTRLNQQRYLQFGIKIIF